MDGALTVTELTARIKSCLEGAFRAVRVEGEVSNHKFYPSGHRYFTLKDDGAQIRVVLFRGRERSVSGEIRDGQSVVVAGSVGVFEKKGEYQIYAHSVQVRGVGSLLLEIEKRKARLAAEGLFDPEKKRPLPAFPARIGIVTSRQGAALRDMIRVARRRWPSIGITLAPALVQGEGAAEDIARAISALSGSARPAGESPREVDVIIVGRGGGSAEDLRAFNEEAVVRAIAASPVPTISAVGHETDFTLSDLAADHRASTPTAAAQMAVPDRIETGDRVAALAARAAKAERYVRETCRREWRIASGALADPRPLLQSRRYAVAAATDALVESVAATARAARDEVSRLATSVRLNSPVSWVSRRRGEVSALVARSVRRSEAVLAVRRAAHGVCRGKLAALDPTAVLRRGYAIATHGASGRAVRSVAEVRTGDPLRIRVSDGSIGVVAGEEGD